MLVNTDELANMVVTAEKAIEDLDDPALRRIAFEQVLDHLLSGSRPDKAESIHEHPQPTGTAGTVQEADGTFASEQQRVDALAHYFKISPADVRHIFDISNENPELVLPTSRLTESKAEGTREITLLVAGARTALGQETTTSNIREAADHFGKLDASNFMASLGTMAEISVLGKPRSPNRVVRMRATGAEAAQVLAQRITSE